MDWVPVVFVIFKVLVLGTGAFFAIKWHFDQGQKEKEMDRHAVLRASGKAAAVFVLSLVVVGLFTFVLGRMLELDLSFP